MKVSNFFSCHDNILEFDIMIFDINILWLIAKETNMVPMFCTVKCCSLSHWNSYIVFVSNNCIINSITRSFIAVDMIEKMLQLP